jgi:hypothetical protein
MNIGLLLLSASWLVKDHYSPWLSFHSEALAVVALVPMMAARLWGHAKASMAPSILVPVVLLALIPWVQFAFGTIYFAGDAVVTTIYLLGFSLAIWIGSSVGGQVHEFEFHRAIAIAIAIPALLSAGIGWCQWFVVDDIYLNWVMPSPSGLASGNISQPNLHGTFLLMGLIAFAFLLRLRTIGIGVFTLAVIFLSGALAMTQSRAAIVSALVMSIYLVYKRRQFLPQLKSWHIGGWFAAYFCIRSSLPLLGNLLLISEKKTHSLTSSSYRWEIWEQVSTAVFQAPWLGYGWNQTFKAQTVGALSHPNEITYTYAHNVVLDMLAWNGIPLGLVIVLAVAYWLLTRIRLVKTPSSIFALGAILPIATHSMFEFPFAYANFVITSGLLVGVIESDIGIGKRFVIRAECIYIFCIAFVVTCALVLLEYVKVEEDYRVVRFENLRIGDTSPDYEVPHLLLLTHMGAMLEAARTLPVAGMTPLQIETLSEASHRFPYGLLMYKYAVSLALNGNVAMGMQQMNELKAIFGEQYYIQCKPAYTKATGQFLP